MSDEREKRLISMLDRTISFVRYSEAKNGAIVALSASLTVGVLNLISNHILISKTMFILALVAFALSAVISLISFLPILEPIRSGTVKDNVSKRNPLFFGHTATLSPEDLLEELYRDGKQNRTHLELFYAEQIATNSCIAKRKYHIFKFACLVLIAGILLLVIAEFARLAC